MTHHCWWCRLQDWIFEDELNVAFAVLMAVLAVILLSTLLFFGCVVGATLLSI